MTITIIGGTGTVGGLTAAIVADAGASVRIVSRAPPKGAPHPRVAHRTADLADPSSLGPALDGTETLFLITPFVARETAMGLGAVEAALAAGVRKIVYMAIMNLEKLARVPHFGNKIPIKCRVLEAAPTAVILEPNFFFQNDFMFLPAMLHAGVFPLPLGSVGLDAIDARDIAEVAAKALLTADLDDQVIPISGRDRLTGPSVAATYADILGRPVHYAGDGLDRFGDLVRQAMPGADDWLVEDLTIMSEENQRQGNHATPAQVEALEAILGHPVRRHADFAREAVAMMAAMAPGGPGPR